MIAIRDDHDPTLQAVLRPLFLLDRQLQHATELCISLKDLQDLLEDDPVPRCLPMIQFCIQTLERMINEMTVYRLILLYRLQRTLTLVLQRHARTPLIDLEL